jgi:uncharacterized protein YutE (UPF0331/DUF86 family)
MMTTTQNRRERQRVLELIQEYRAKGFIVLEPSSPEELPEFMRTSGYVPDLIVRSKKENLVVEVKSSESVASLDSLSDVSELVNAQEGWHFVLVLTNPRQEKSSMTPSTSRSKVLGLLERAKHIGSLEDPQLLEAWFIYAWVAAEACLDLLSARQEKEKTRPLGALTYIRDLAMQGELDRKDAQRLERLYKTRSAFLHSVGDAKVVAADVDWLQRFTESLLIDAENIQHSASTDHQT